MTESNFLAAAKHDDSHHHHHAPFARSFYRFCKGEKQKKNNLATWTAAKVQADPKQVTITPPKHGGLSRERVERRRSSWGSSKKVADLHLHLVWIMISLEKKSESSPLASANNFQQQQQYVNQLLSDF